MSCDVNRLTAYRDDALSPEERAATEAHLKDCARCRAELAELQERSRLIARRLAVLDPDPSLTPQASDSLSHVLAAARNEDRSVRPSLVQRTKGSITMQRNTRLSTRLRLIAGGLAAVVAIGLLVSFAPAREAAAQFLSIFRVESFAVVPVDDGYQGNLDSIDQMLESGVLGEPDYIREPSEPELVADSAAASERAGFQVLEIGDLMEDVEPRETYVATGPHMRYDVDRATAVLALAAAGIEDFELPALDSFTLEVDIPAIVTQEYEVDQQQATLIQAVNPTVQLPPGVPPQLLGEAFLRFLGLSDESAQRLAAEIDWTSTLVVPMPEAEARYWEVEVNGSPALLLRSKAGGYQSQPGMLMWQRDGMAYALAGAGMSNSLMVRAAESLH